MLVLECHDGRPFRGLRGIERIDELDLHMIQPKFYNGMDHHLRTFRQKSGSGVVRCPTSSDRPPDRSALTSSVPSTADAFTRPSTSFSGIVPWPGQPSGSCDHPEQYIEQRYNKFVVAAIYLFLQRPRCSGKCPLRSSNVSSATSCWISDLEGGIEERRSPEEPPGSGFPVSSGTSNGAGSRA